MAIMPTAALIVRFIIEPFSSIPVFQTSRWKHIFLEVASSRLRHPPLCRISQLFANVSKMSFRNDDLAVLRIFEISLFAILSQR
ncbi:hypothetical protein [Bifidobacterium moukalabense]|uniref:hypothetical protein n=1 Tax=Bifidobacterium moukalabense TaxID=1333651 RepID=UPI0014853260|nr:hypothetical protein [Bifidobacterium moukalabense]